MLRVVCAVSLAALAAAGGGGQARAEGPASGAPDSAVVRPAAPDTAADPSPRPGRARQRDVTELSLFAEEGLVVTPARHSQSAAFSPSIVSVITAEGIRCSASNNLADLFRSIPGMDVLCSYDTQTDVVPRGLITYQSAKVLVLVNGHRVNNDYLGSVLWRQLPVGLNDIQRIEIVRGPGSALYGANALAGIINIITRRPGRRDRGQAQVRYGTFSTREAYLSQAGAEGKIGYSISGGYYRSGGWGDVGELDTLGRYPIAGYAARRLSGVQTKIKDRSLLEKFLVLVDAELPQGVAMEFDAGFARGTVAVPEFTSIYSLSEASQFNSNVALRLSRAGLVSDDRLRFSFDHVVTDIDSGYMASKTRRLGADLQYDLALFRRNMVMFGLGWEEVEGNGRTVGNAKRGDRLRAVYVQDEYSPPLLAGCNLTAGLRLDKHSDMAAVASPRLALSISPLLGHVVRAAAGTAFRKPNFIENYYCADLGAGRIGRGMNSLEGDVYDATAGGLLLRRSQRPERIYTYELGYEVQPVPFLTAELNLFRSRVSGLIGYRQYDSVRIGTTTYDEITVYTNLRDVTSRGAELEFRARPFPWLYSYVNFTYQEVRDVTDPGNPVPLAESSRRKVNIGLRASRWGATASTALHCIVDPTVTTSPAYLTGVPLGPYNTVDAALGCGRAVRGVLLSATVAVHNMFDKRHVEYPVFGSANYVLPAGANYSMRDEYLNRNALNERKIIGTLGASF